MIISSINIKALGHKLWKIVQEPFFFYLECFREGQKQLNKELSTHLPFIKVVLIMALLIEIW